MDINEKKSKLNLSEKTILVIGGGDIMGISIIGCLQKLEEHHLNFRKLKTFVGTSVGAIICFLLYIGCSCNDIIKTIKQNDELFDVDDIDIDNLFHKFGLISDKNILNIIEICIKEQNIQFETFYDLQKIYPDKSLIITGTNLSLMQCEYFSSKHTPYMSVIKALQISYCIPFIFYKQIYNNNVYCDGALNNIIALEYLQSKESIGIYVDTSNNISNIDTPLQYLSKILTTAIHGKHKQIINDNKLIENNNLIILKSLANVNILEYNKDIIDELIHYGYINTNLKKNIHKKIKNE